MPLRLDVKRRLLARSDRVKSTDLHPVEPWMLVSLYNGNVHIWNYENQQLVKSFEVRLSSLTPPSSLLFLKWCLGVLNFCYILNFNLFKWKFRGLPHFAFTFNKLLCIIFNKLVKGECRLLACSCRESIMIDLRKEIYYTVVPLSSPPFSHRKVSVKAELNSQDMQIGLFNGFAFKNQTL